ncbi:HAD family hydrolase [Candidatus Enterococcus mansonii]|uniref:Uncharacterized protein n=1 Tax=Candidatus Enterococcus mansonii TaxID=1834181 RepID=A0A242CL17_9ENTE|nr:hypothetical protein [Enterococcus sp. 4G2_DIV0659]OTO10610.1 hypothetical protein A5880_001294 [Enterococcus sp. 4G2_DIV0659]
MKTIKLIAVDIDGVLLEDTFSPVLYRLAKKFNVDYTLDIEKNAFSQNRESAGLYLKKKFRLSEDTTIQQMLDLYFSERDSYLNETYSKSSIVKGALDFITRLTQYDVHLICYGGLAYEQISSEFQPYLDYFEQYVCTNNFRPGLKEIIQDMYKIDFKEALFVDDVDRVAKEAKKYKVPFIGVPAIHSWGFQEEEMKKTGVKYMVKSVNEITQQFLEKIDSDNEIWEGEKI